MSENGLCCKRCGVSDYAKSGLARGHQRTRCRACGCHFTDTPLRGKPPAMKAVAVLKWARSEAASLPEQEVPASMVTAEVDEIWRFVKKACQAVGLARL